MAWNLTRNTIRYRFMVSMSTILAVGTIVLCTVVASYEGYNQYHALQEKGAGFAQYVAKLGLDPLVMGDSIQLDSLVDEVEGDDVLYTVILDREGKIVTSRFSSLNFRSPRMATFKGSLHTFDELDDILTHIKSLEPVVEVTAPIVTGTETIGRVKIGLSKHDLISGIVNSMLVIIGVNFVIAIFLGIVMFSVSEKTLLQPISLLAEAVRQIAGGDLSARLTVPAEGELRVLIDNFNRMAENLRVTTVSREYVNSIFASMSEALIILSSERLILDLNAAASSLLGYDSLELRERSIEVVFPEFPVRTGSDTGTPHLVSLDTVCIRKDGSPVPIFLSTSGLRDADGTVRGIVCCALDGTEIKRVSRKLEESNAALTQEVEQRRRIEEQVTELNRNLVNRSRELERVVAELESFCYSVSHDLRAPLRGIDGFSNALLEDYGDRLDQEGRDYLGRIRNGCVRMGRLIDDLLRLSRISRADIRRKAVDLSEIACNIVEDLSRVEPERTVACEIEPGIVADADPVLIRSVLENLLGNAWKFTRRTGHARIEFGILPDEGEPTCFVRDNGAGFNMEYADKLFGAFQRLHRSADFEGSGIGLASVQRVIHRHGGRVWAEAVEGAGATFYFTLGGNIHGCETDSAG